MADRYVADQRALQPQPEPEAAVQAEAHHLDNFLDPLRRHAAVARHQVIPVASDEVPKRLGFGRVQLTQD